jgi:di/tricarboxylate transporter
MTDQMLIVFGILAGAVGLFAWGRPRVDIVAILVVLALMLSRVLTPQESLAGFGDPVVILIAAIFIVGEAMVNTGVAHRLGEAVLKAGAGNETRLIVLIMVLAGGIGAFMSSSAIVAMFIPVVLTIANRTGLNRKRMLMPLSVATLISGMMTLIASSPNMIIESALRASGIPPLGFFSWTPVRTCRDWAPPRSTVYEWFRQLADDGWLDLTLCCQLGFGRSYNFVSRS